MKVIFLDIDGVLNSMSSVLAYQTYRKLDEVSCRLINRLCERYDYKIVISSTWRKLYRPLELKTILVSRGFDTYSFMQDSIFFTPEHSSGFRGYEVEQWCIENQPEKFIIIDDDTDFFNLDEAMIHFTSSEYGKLQCKRFIQVKGFFGFNALSFEQTANLMEEDETK